MQEQHGRIVGVGAAGAWGRERAGDRVAVRLDLDVALDAAGVRALAVVVALLALRPGTGLSGTYDRDKSRDQRKPTGDARSCPHHFPLIRVDSWRLTPEVCAKTGSRDDKRKGLWTRERSTGRTPADLRPPRPRHEERAGLAAARCVEYGRVSVEVLASLPDGRVLAPRATAHDNRDRGGPKGNLERVTSRSSPWST